MAAQYLKKGQIKLNNDLYAKYACNQIAKLVKQKIEEFIREYYKEYSPEQYKRTWAFLNSVVKTEAEQVGNKWVARVYIDTSIEYPSYWGDDHWDMGNTAYFANQSRHGNAVISNMKFFDNAYEEVLNNKHLTSSLAAFLAKQGIKVTYRQI